MNSEFKKDIKKVSVIVPNYNYAKYLRRRVISILRQTYPIHEIIILDDASEDRSVRVICELTDEIRRRRPEIKVKTIFNKTNSGKAILQWEEGVKVAKGEYVWIAEADDAARKEFLRGVMKGFDEDAEVVLSYSESAVMNGVGIVFLPNFRRFRDKEGTGHFRRSYIREGEEEIQEIMAIRCTIPNVSAAVFKKTPELLKYMKKAEKFLQVGDWYLYVKIIRDGKIAYNGRSLNLFRVHKGSATKHGEKHLEEVLKMHEYFRKKYDLSPRVLKWMKEEEERLRKKYL